MAASSSGDDEGSTCFVCGSLSDSETYLLFHLNSEHPIIFGQLLREKRVKEYFPNADPFILQAWSNEDNRYGSVEIETINLDDSLESEEGKSDSRTSRKDDGCGNGNIDQQSIGEGTSNANTEMNTSAKSPTPSPIDGILASYSRNRLIDGVLASYSKIRPIDGIILENVSCIISDEEKEDETNQSEIMEGNDSNNEQNVDEHDEHNNSKQTGDSRSSTPRELFFDNGERPPTGTGSYTDVSVVYSTGHHSHDRRSRTRSRSRSRSNMKPRSYSRPRYRSRSPRRRRGNGRPRSNSKKRFFDRYEEDRRRATTGQQRGHVGFVRLPFTYRLADLIGSCPNAIPIPCLICKQVFECGELLTHELRFHDQIWRFYCGVIQCAYKAHTKKDLEMHMSNEHRHPNSRLQCRNCNKYCLTQKEYVEHATHEYCKLRRIHYDQIALLKMDVKCKRCGHVMLGKFWFEHFRKCGANLDDMMNEQIIEWGQTFEKNSHPRDMCRFFPACKLRKCTFLHPLCCHHPDCRNHKTARCHCDHDFNDRQLNKHQHFNDTSGSGEGNE